MAPPDLPPPDRRPETAASRDQEDAQHRRALSLLIDLGSDYARDLGAPEIDPLDRADPFERIGRVIHRSIRIVHLIREPVTDTDAADIDPAAELARHRTAIRTQILREVEDTIERTAPTRLASLRAELLERLDDPDLDDDIARRPVAELIAELIRDLGLASRCGGQPTGRRTPADIAHLQALAAASPGQAVARDAANPTPKTDAKPRPSAKPPTPPEPASPTIERPGGNLPGTIRPDSLLATLLRRPDG